EGIAVGGRSHRGGGIEGGHSARRADWGCSIANGTAWAKNPKLWQPCTPAMAAGLSDHVWSLTEVLLYRVPPWPPPQAVSEPVPLDDRRRKRSRCTQMQTNWVR